MSKPKRQSAKLYRKGYPVARIAEIYGVTRATIYNDLAADADLAE